MIKDKRQRDYIEKRKERGERKVDFYAQGSFIDTLDDFCKKVGLSRTHVIKSIIMSYLKKRGYKFEELRTIKRGPKFDELWTIMDKPKKDVL